MNSGILLKLSIAALLAAVSSGCLVKQTVTRNGEVVEDDYVIKRPIKEVLENTQRAE